MLTWMTIFVRSRKWLKHVQNNTSVPEMLANRGIKPENLPAAEDIKKLERRVDSEQKRIEKATKKLPKKYNEPPKKRM